MALLKRNAAAALEKARADHVAVEAKRGELVAQREAMLADLDGDVGGVLILDRAIADENAKLHTLEDRIARLQSQLATEESLRREAEYRTKVDAIEKALPKLQQPDAKIKSVLVMLADAIEEKLAAQSAFIRGFPSGIDPPRFVTARLERAIADAFVNFKAVPDRIDRIRQVADNFPPAEAAGYHKFVAELRAQPAAPPAEEKAA